jgi:hypothetical protein
VPHLRELSERLQISETIYASAMGLTRQYHAACSRFDWVEADRLRVIIIETFEASLDATAAIFKMLEPHDGAS